VARPRLFDPDAALDAALGAFTARGYEATSVQDLVEATGLSRSSLYAAFGDKHGLYLAALDRYGCADATALARSIERAPSPLAGIRAYLDAVAGGCGCFAFNAAAERGATDPDTARRAAEGWHALHRAFADALRAAQAAGEIGKEQDPDALAASLAATVYGLRGMQNAGAPREALASVVGTTFGALVRAA
jgi:TetR/AcrR family transcriptional repressor of nem operon